MKTTSLKDKILGNRKKEDAGKPEKAEPMPWYAYRMQPISARALRREREREIKRNTKKYEKGQRRDAAEGRRQRDYVAATEVRAIEARLGLPAGGLLDKFVAQGTIPGGLAVAPSKVIQAYDYEESR